MVCRSAKAPRHNSWQRSLSNTNLPQPRHILSMPDTDSSVRASNSGLKRTFQKLLLKRTSKPSKTRTHTGQLPDNGSLAQRDAQLDNADNSVVTQPSDQLNSWLDNHAQQESPFRAPAPPVGSDEEGTGVGTDQASLASEEV